MNIDYRILFFILQCSVLKLKADVPNHITRSHFNQDYVDADQKDCSLLLNAFAQYASDLTMCSIKFARPIKLCEQCIDEYMNFRQKYQELLNTIVNGTSCKSMFISQDRLDVVLEYHNNILSIWNKAHCYVQGQCGSDWTILMDTYDEHYKIPEDVIVSSSRPDIFLLSKRTRRIVLVELTVPWETNIPKDHTLKINKYYDLINELTKSGYVVKLYAVEVGARACYDWSNPAEPVLSNETKRFNTLYADTTACIQKYSSENTSEVCDKCMQEYLQLDNFYKTLSEDAVGVDSVCMDVFDSMNATRSTWSKTLNCCKIRRTPEVKFLCCAAIMSALPLFYYIILRYCGPIRDFPNVLKQSRFKQTILRTINRS